MRDAVVERPEVERPSYDLENLVVLEGRLHGHRVGSEQEVAVIREDTCGWVIREHVVQLAEGLNNCEGFTLIRRPVL